MIHSTHEYIKIQKYIFDFCLSLEGKALLSGHLPHAQQNVCHITLHNVCLHLFINGRPPSLTAKTCLAGRITERVTKQQINRL